MRLVDNTAATTGLAGWLAGLFHREPPGGALQRGLMAHAGNMRPANACLVAGAGVEPAIPEYEPGALPLGYPAIGSFPARAFLNATLRSF